MIIKNPHTGHRFFTQMQEKDSLLYYFNYATREGYSYKVANSAIVFERKAKEEQLPGYRRISSNSQILMLEVDEKNHVKFYESDNTLGSSMPITLNVLSVSFDKETVIYTETLVDNTDKKHTVFYSTFMTEVDKDDMKILQTIENDFVKRYPDLQIDKLNRRYFRYSGDDFFMLNSDIIFSHRNHYTSSPKYKKIVDNGFIHILRPYLSYSEKTVMKHVNEIYEYLKGVKKQDVPEELAAFITKHENKEEDLLKLYFSDKYSFELKEIKAFKTIFREFSKKALEAYDYLKEKVNKDNHYTNEEFFALIKKNITFIDEFSGRKKTTSPFGIIDKMPTIDKVKGEGYSARLLERASSYNNWTEAFYQAERVIYRNQIKALDEMLNADDYRKNCDVNSVYSLGSVLFAASKITSINELCDKEIKAIIKTGLAMDKHKIFIKIKEVQGPLDSNSGFDFIVVLDIKERTSAAIILSLDIPCAIVSSCRECLEKELLVPFYKMFLNRSLN